MEKPDLTRVVKVKISVLLPDGKRWDFVPVDEKDITAAVMLVYGMLERAKVDGPYSTDIDNVKIGGVVPKE